MPAIQQHHFVLAVPDAQATARYFIDQLGFELRLDLGGWVFVRRDECVVRLGSCPDAIAPAKLGDHRYFAYWIVDDAAAYHAEIMAKGGLALTEPKDQPWGMREFVLATPDGHRLMVAQVLE